MVTFTNWVEEPMLKQTCHWLIAQHQHQEHPGITDEPTDWAIRSPLSLSSHADRCTAAYLGKALQPNNVSEPRFVDRKVVHEPDRRNRTSVHMRMRVASRRRTVAKRKLVLMMPLCAGNRAS
jgi:hypothetical protein